jgi:hypothetical protein
VELYIFWQLALLSLLGDLSLIKKKVKKVKLSHYTPWRNMGGEEV